LIKFETDSSAWCEGRGVKPSCARRISIVPLVPNLGCGLLWPQQIMIEFANGLDRRPPGFRSDRRLPGRPHPAIELASRAVAEVGRWLRNYQELKEAHFEQSLATRSRNDASASPSIAAELAPQQPKTGTNSDNLSWNDDSRELAEGRGHVDCPWRTPLVHPASPPHLTS
jgi:hypothetical protein